MITLYFTFLVVKFAFIDIIGVGVTIIIKMKIGAVKNKKTQIVHTDIIYRLVNTLILLDKENLKTQML